LDPVAVESARENVALNKLEKFITVKESDLLSLLGGEGVADTAAGEMWPSARPGHNLEGTSAKQETEDSLGVTLPVQIVVANILAEIIVLFTDDVYRALQPGGLYITSGIYKDKEELVANALQESGFEIIEISREEDWVAFTAGKR
jgi:ribosomal protein L11 methyltransferase